MYFKPYIFKN